MEDNKLIYVTGFGIFRGHEKLNASSEAVKLLPSSITVNSTNFTIKKLEIPVIYNEVDKFVEKIWNSNPKPSLVIHCGVDGHTNNIKIECCSRTSGYCALDYAGQCLSDTQVCVQSNPNCSKLDTTLPVQQIVNDINKTFQSKEICKASCDPGSYLCAYIYLKSLDNDPDRTLFVHVPTIDKIPSQQTTDIILDIAQKCLLHLFEQNKI